MFVLYPCAQAPVIGGGETLEEKLVIQRRKGPSSAAKSSPAPADVSSGDATRQGRPPVPAVIDVGFTVRPPHSTASVYTYHDPTPLLSPAPLLFPPGEGEEGLSPSPPHPSGELIAASAAPASDGDDNVAAFTRYTLYAVSCCSFVTILNVCLEGAIMS